MPNSLKNLILLLFLTLSFSGLSLASEALLNIDHYNVPEGLSQSTVTSVVEDKYGYVWIGTLNGLNRFDGSKFKHFYSENNDYSLPSSFIRSLYIDKSGRLLIGTDKGLASYDYELEKFVNHNDVLKIEKNAIWSINESENIIIIGTEQHLIEVDHEIRTKLNSIKIEASGLKKIIPIGSIYFAIAYNGNVYKIIGNSVVNLGKYEGLIKYGNSAYGWIGNTLENLESKEYIEILKNTKSIFEYDNDIIALKDEILYSIVDGAINKIGKTESDIQKNKDVRLFLTNSGIYIATQNNGFSFISSKRNTLKTFNSINNVWSINSLTDNKLLITSDSNLIKIYDTSLNEMVSYNSGVAGPKSAILKKDLLYVATQSGLISIHIKNNKKTTINNNEFFVVKNIIGTNNIVAGTTDGRIVKINTENNESEKIDIDIGNPIFDINVMGDEYLIATQGGLFKLKNGKLDKIFKEDLAISIYRDDDVIYFGTRTSLYKIKNNTLTKIINNNKPVYAIEIKEELIISSSNSEIAFTNKKTDKTITLTSSYGSQDEYNVQAISIIGDNIYIGGISGITKVSISEVKQAIKLATPSNVMLDELLIFNIPERINNGILNKSLQFSKKIKLKYSDYPFSFRFNSPGNLDKNLQYTYQMLGLSDNWLTSKGINSATYTNLSPGEYTFNVRAIDSLTNQLGPIKSIDVEITPPWWLSLQAKLIYFSIFLIISSIIAKVILKKREIQRQIAKSEERLKLSLWGSGDEMWDWDIETGQIYRSNIWGSLEFPRDGQRSGEQGQESNIHPMDQERVNTALNKHFYGETDHFEAAYRVKGKDEQWVWILDRAKIVERDEDDKALRMTGTIKNISNFKQAEEQLRLFERAIENISEGMFILDNEFKFVEVNEACCDLCETSRNDFIGSTFKFDLYPESYSQQIRSILQQQGSWSNEVESPKGDSSSFLMELTVDAIYDEQGVLSHYVGVFSDISRRKQQEEELRKLTNNDLLTNLPNRSSLMVTLGNLVKKDTHHTLMILDLDNFKKINDSLGHQVGDELLIKVAQRIEANVPRHTSIYRLGGDEFAILIDNNPDIGSSAVIANNVVDAFLNPFELARDRVVVGVSIGIVLYPEDDQNEQALLRKADIAMYHAKSAGGNRYQFYSESLNRNAIRQLEVENLIRQGLKEDLFEVYYQPKVDLKSGKMAGMEALVRLNHPTLGLIPPNEFIPLAEENGLIVEIGEVVMRKACFAAQNWRNQGLFNGRVAVNLSSLQFALPDLQQRIESILRLTQLPASNLELEITEGTVIKHPEKAIKVMMQLSKMGVSLALDDFGTGYSSLSYLKRFPINTLKIDKAFVDDIDKSDRDLKMVDSIITIAHNMGLSVVGEGVEDASQLSILKALKCEEIQGFIFSKAVTEHDFSELLKRENLQAQSIDNIKKA